MSTASPGRSSFDSFYARAGKRAVDVVISIPVTILLAPIAIVIGIAIRMEDQGPVLFVQERVGRYGDIFRLWKFRSMPTNVANVPSARAGALQVTKVGKVIRRTNLDEVPQLMNVLTGRMTLVGPRPALPAQVSLIEMRRRNGAIALKPGLTGLAQVNSYDGMPEDEKAEWDAKYLSKLGALTDLRVLLRTIAYLFRKPPQY